MTTVDVAILPRLAREGVSVHEVALRVRPEPGSGRRVLDIRERRRDGPADAWLYSKRGVVLGAEDLDAALAGILAAQELLGVEGEAT